MKLQSVKEPNSTAERLFSKGSQIKKFYLVTAAILLIGFISYAVSSWIDVRKQVESDLNHINRLFSQSIESAFLHHETVLKILGLRFLDIDAGNYPERGRGLIDDLMEVNPAMAGFGLSQPNGQLLLVSGIPAGKPLPNLLEQIRSTATFMQVFDTNRMVVGRTYFMPLLNKWLIPIRIAVRDEQNFVKLVMSAGLDVDASGALWNATALPEKMRITLLRQDGFVQLSLPTLVSDRIAIYDEPFLGELIPAIHRPLDQDPFYPESNAVSSSLLDGQMRSFVSYPGSHLWDKLSHQLVMPTLLFTAAFLLTWILFRSVLRNQRHYESQLLNQAHFDALTNLPNRFLALDRLTQLLKEAKRDNEKVAVLFIDLDDFKKINDSLGHEMGDKILVQAAGRLSEAVRAGDTIGRLGGDEFVVLLGGINDAIDARSVAENLLDHFQEPYRLDNRELALTASIGIAIYPDDGASPAELLRNADSAMYHSKEQGRNIYHFFTEAMNKDVTRRLLLEEYLRGALERDELYLCYQPLVDVVTRSIIGTEALLRWTNPTLGTVTPDEFIPIAEQSGLIVPIGRFVLNNALKMNALWQDCCGQDLKISVNLSPRQFRDPDLLTFIQQTLKQTGIRGASLELEITEGVLMSSHTQVDAALAALSDLGISISMDDFGTGYSSLSYLRSYPFDTLKIDRGFVNDITVDPQDRELVNAAIAMAHSLGLKVVAEGVETEEQFSLLAAQGCEIVQGYLFSKPVSAEKIKEMLVSERCK